MQRVALYARVSTADQRTDGQLDTLREYAGRRGLQAFEFIDHGVSGRKDRRPALDAMMEAVRRREVDAVAAVKLDRIARSVRHLCDLAAELDALGVPLIILDQSIDTGTPAGRFMFHTLAAVAELERDLIMERTKAGVEAARRRGKRIGRPSVCDRASKQRIVRLQRCGRSHREIAAIVGISKGTVTRVLLARAQ